MGIACLGWGSLIWKPGTLPVSGPWNKDGPWLPVEYARHSTSQRITLVLVAGAQPVQVLWALLTTPSLLDAREALRQRESTVLRHIGFWPTAGEPDSDISRIIGNWAQERNLDGVVWTALPPKWNGQSGVVPTVEQVLHFFRGVSAGSDAERYVRRTPPQVQTAYRERIEAELGWTPE